MCNDYGSDSWYQLDTRYGTRKAWAVLAAVNQNYGSLVSPYGFDTSKPIYNDIGNLLGGNLGEVMDGNGNNNIIATKKSDGTACSSPITFYADGRLIQKLYGGFNPNDGTGQSGYTCNDWSSTGGQYTGAAGGNVPNNGVWKWSGFGGSCTDSLPHLCLVEIRA
jgi:hypothetical protein